MLGQLSASPLASTIISASIAAANVTGADDAQTSLVVDSAVCLPATHHIQAPSRSDRLIKVGRQIDTVNRQQIDI